VPLVLSRILDTIFRVMPPWRGGPVQRGWRLTCDRCLCAADRTPLN
jgi:hypothetical protein